MQTKIPTFEAASPYGRWRPIIAGRVAAVGLLLNYPLSMPHHLDTNRAFLKGSMLLAFAVIFVVVTFVLMSLRLQKSRGTHGAVMAEYVVHVAPALSADTLRLSVNDSLQATLCLDGQAHALRLVATELPAALQVHQLGTDRLFIFELSDYGGSYLLCSEGDDLLLKPAE